MVIMRPVIFGSISTCDIPEDRRALSPPTASRILMRHFAVPRIEAALELYCRAREIPRRGDLGQIIVLVDIDANLISFSFAPPAFLSLSCLGKIVTEFPERNDFANRRISGRATSTRSQTTALRFTQGVRQLHDAQLLAARSIMPGLRERECGRLHEFAICRLV